MLRLVELALFLAPFVLFAVWRFSAMEAGPPVRLIAAAAGLLVVLVVSLVWLHREAALPPGTGYEPPHWEDGHVVSGRAVPR